MSKKHKFIPKLLTTVNVNYTRYRDRDSKLRIVLTAKVKDDAEILGVDLRDFRVLQELEEDPVGPGVARSSHDIADNRLDMTGESSYINITAIIAKVTCNQDDSIRAIYTSLSDETPLCIVDRLDHRYCTNYELADAGNYVVIKGRSGHYFNFVRTYREAVASDTGHPLEEARRLHYAKYTAELANRRKELVKDYVPDGFDSLGIGLFTFNGLQASYSDTVIEFDCEEDVKTAIAILNTNTKNDFQDDLQILVKVSKDGIKVNGTKVAGSEFSDGNGATRYKVNGKLIAKDDYKQVVDRVTCYPGDQQGYDDFVDLVSRMSLKFHRLVRDGVPLSVEMLKILPAGKLPSYMNLNHSAEVVVLPIRKSPRNNMEVMWLGEWRKIATAKQDAFMTVAAPTAYRYRDKVANELWSHNLTHLLSCFEAGVTDERLVASRGYTEYHKLDDKARALVDKRKYALKILAAINTTLVESDKVKVGPAHVAYHEFGKAISLADQLLKEFAGLVNKAQEIVERSKKLLDEVCDTPRVVETMVKNAKGYKVTGESGKVYFVKESDASVSNYATGAHICIVNGGVNNTKGYDYLTSVIGALLADKYTARAIHTLNV